MSLQLLRKKKLILKKLEMMLRVGHFAHPKKEIVLCIEDEGRFGLKPIIGRMWSPLNLRPIIPQKRGYQWFYTYSFVEPKTGRCDFFILSTVSTELMQIALDEFFKSIDHLDSKLIFIVLDQAGWHMSKNLKVPKNVVLVPLPADTPELSPAEPLIGKLKIPIVNKTFLTLDDVSEVIEEECQRLIMNPREIRSLTLFPWVKKLIESI